MKQARGSRKHVLDLLDSGRFSRVMSELLGPHGVSVSDGDAWQPHGPGDAGEWTLRRFCVAHCREAFDYERFDAWWVPDKYTNPQWDILSTCSIGDDPGLLLVEAKANDQELDWKGKPLNKGASEQSAENHQAITRCIANANDTLNLHLPGFALSIDSHYQLCNRIASAWKLAQCGMPVALLYLGFTGDEGIRNVGAPIADCGHWQRLMGSYLSGVAPQHFPGMTIRGEGKGSLRMLIEAVPVLEHSLVPEGGAKR